MIRKEKEGDSENGFEIFPLSKDIFARESFLNEETCHYDFSLKMFV